MKDIAIYGAGGFGREIACLIRNHLPEWNIVGFFDDGKKKGEAVSPFGEILGGINELNSWNHEIATVIAIGNPKIVCSLVEKITNEHVTYPNIIHPNFEMLDQSTFKIGKGNILTAGCRASCNVSMGNFNILNGSIIMGHDVTIGSYNSFMPAVRVSGEVKIGDSNFFGVASIILQQIHIGEGIKLSAGSVLMTKPKNGQLYMGNPARKTEF